MATCPKTPSTTPPRSARASSKAASGGRGQAVNAQIIDPKLLDADGRCVFGATVELEDLDSGEVVTYQIVGEDEADIKAGKISVNSPMARA
jgi:transcription elongation factor GreA